MGLITLHRSSLFNFFVNGVSIAVGAKLLQFETGGGITTIFGSRVTGNTGGSLAAIRATFGTFKGNNQANAFLASHSLFSSCFLRGTANIRKH